MSTYVVVGAIGNIGLGFARKLAADPANTVITLNRREPLEKVDRVHDVRADLLDLESMRGQTWTPSIGKREEEELGRQLSEAFATNTVGSLQLISLLLSALRRGKTKKIVYLTSPNGVLPVVQAQNLSGRLPYSTSKAAANMGIVQIANELRPEGFTTFAIAPSFVHDDRNLKKFGVDPDAVTARIRKSNPEHEGLVHPDEAVEIMLGVVDRFGPDDSGRIVGMWGSEDRW